MAPSSVCSGKPDLLQSGDLAAGQPQSSEEQVHAVLVLGQQGSRRLVVLPQDQLQKLGLGPQQGRGVRAGLLQEPVQDGKQGGEDGLRTDGG